MPKSVAQVVLVVGNVAVTNISSPAAWRGMGSGWLADPTPLVFMVKRRRVLPYRNETSTICNGNPELSTRLTDPVAMGAPCTDSRHEGGATEMLGALVRVVKAVEVVVAATVVAVVDVTAGPMASLPLLQPASRASAEAPRTAALRTPRPPLMPTAEPYRTLRQRPRGRPETERQGTTSDSQMLAFDGS
jgi:hypothetical protein